MTQIKLYSWNVNGIRAIEKKGFLDWLAQCQGAPLLAPRGPPGRQPIPDASEPTPGGLAMAGSSAAGGF